MNSMRAAAFMISAMATIASPLSAEADEPQTRVARLVRLLGSRSYARRVHATNALEQIGDAAREGLHEAAASDDVEVSRRARGLLAKLGAEDLWQARGVTLDGHQRPASEVLSIIAEQSGNRLVAGDPPYASLQDGPLTLAARDQPYWQVLDALCRQSGNRFRPHYDFNKRGLVVVSGKPDRSPVAYTGPVRAAIVSAKRAFTEVLDYETGRTKVEHTFQFDLTLDWEDRFRLVAYKSEAEVAAAVGEGGVTIRPIGTGRGRWVAATDATRQAAMTIALQPPPVAVKSLTELRMRWPLIAVGEMATLEIANPTAGQIYCQDDVRLRVDALMQVAPRRWKIDLVLRRDLVMPEPAAILFHENDIELTDAAGRPFRHSVGNEDATNREMTEAGLAMRLKFIGETATSKPTHLRITYPRRRSHRELEIIFRDLSLPTAVP